MSGFIKGRYEYKVHINSKDVVYDENLEALIRDSVNEDEFCYEVRRKGYRLIYIAEGNNDVIDVHVYPDKTMDFIPRDGVWVSEFSMQYFSDLYKLFKETHSASRWFKKPKDEYFALKSILKYELGNDIVRIAINRKNHAIGYISVSSGGEYDGFVPDLSLLRDKDAVIRYAKDTVMLHQIASCFERKYDCYCRDAMCGDDMCLEVLLDNVTQELYSRGYYTLAMWLNSDRNLEMFERCGFEVDSMFYSKVLNSKIINDSNAIRLIYDM